MSKLAIFRGDDATITVTVNDSDGDAVDITGYTFWLTIKENILNKLNEKFSKREVKTEEIFDGENINPEDYNILRSGLIEKSNGIR